MMGDRLRRRRRMRRRSQWDQSRSRSQRRRQEVRMMGDRRRTRRRRGKEGKMDGLQSQGRRWWWWRPGSLGPGDVGRRGKMRRRRSGNVEAKRKKWPWIEQTGHIKAKGKEAQERAKAFGW